LVILKIIGLIVVDHTKNPAAFEVSFLVAQRIAKAKQPPTVAELILVLKI
jgi:hypothetical protein